MVQQPRYDPEYKILFTQQQHQHQRQQMCEIWLSKHLGVQSWCSQGTNGACS
ncbi:hypothetical protein MKW92_014432, partial [Papaver armeniacum]